VRLRSGFGGRKGWWSEDELHSELRRARAADLIQRIQAAVLAPASERCYGR